MAVVGENQDCSGLDTCGGDPLTGRYLVCVNGKCITQADSLASSAVRAANTALLKSGAITDAQFARMDDAIIANNYQLSHGFKEQLLSALDAAAPKMGATCVSTTPNGTVVYTVNPDGPVCHMFQTNPTGAAGGQLLAKAFLWSGQNTQAPALLDLKTPEGVQQFTAYALGGHLPHADKDGAISYQPGTQVASPIPANFFPIGLEAGMAAYGLNLINYEHLGIPKIQALPPQKGSIAMADLLKYAIVEPTAEERRMWNLEDTAATTDRTAPTHGSTGTQDKAKGHSGLDQNTLLLLGGVGLAAAGAFLYLRKAKARVVA